MFKIKNKIKNKNLKKIGKIVIYTLLIGVLLTACNAQDIKTIRIAKQYGLAYAPLQIMIEKAFLEEAVGDQVKVEWVQLANTAAIREAMLGNGLDVGFMAIPPFLIGIEGGMEWRMMIGLNQSPLGLVTNNVNINSLQDLVDYGKIALPQPGSIQHILLSMAAKKELGESTLFDQQLVSMKHPDAMQALLSSSEVVAHFTSPPYLFLEEDEKDTKVLVTGEEAMGEPFTFIVGACQESFYNTDYYNVVVECIIKSIEFIQDNPEETIEILAKEYELEKEVVKDYLYSRNMIYSDEILGVETFLEFMFEEGMITELYDLNSLEW